MSSGRNPNRNYTYSAHLTDSTGFVVLTASQGKARGHLSLDGEIYEIHPMDNKVHALVKFNPSKASPAACTVDGREPLKPLPRSSVRPSSGRQVACNPVTTGIRVPTLFMPGARQQDANVVQTVELALAQVNGAFFNSGIGQVNVINAGILEYNLPGQETGDIFDDSDRLAADPVANTLRAQREADLVMLVTRDAYGTIAGRARTDFTINAANAFAISNVGTATAQYTYAHELGHLLGCRHQQCSVWDPGFDPDSGCDNRVFKC